MWIQFFNSWTNKVGLNLTTAAHSISIQLVTSVTAADEAPNGVSTNVFTASICTVAFIDVYATTRHCFGESKSPSAITVPKHACTTFILNKLSPLQFNPFTSSWYPVSQLQMKLPMVLVQLCSQPPFAMLHSLISVEQQIIDLVSQSLCQLHQH